MRNKVKSSLNTIENVQEVDTITEQASVHVMEQIKTVLAAVDNMIIS